MFRIGFGIDVHRLVENRPLFLGGVEIPHDKGLLGHSDADVLIHAICDALLGAAALGDIGRHFPDTSGEFAGIDSKILLKRTTEIIREAGYAVVNIDATICAQQPKLAPHIDIMRATLAPLMDIPIDSVSIKATTTEKLGFEGREEGISSQAVALLRKV